MSMLAVLRESKVMRRLWYAQIISVFGDFLAMFAVIGVLTFKLRATPEQITGVQISYLLPIAILCAIAGVFVDRWQLKPTLVASDVIRAGLVLLLLAATQMWHFYAILAAISVISSFFGPAQGVAIRTALPMHGLRSANALIQQVMLLMRIVGPATAAFLVAALGPKSCYLADSVSFVVSASLISTLTLLKPPAAPTAPTSGTAIGRVWSDMRQGIDFILHHAALLFVLLAMAAGMFILGCFGPLIAVYVRDNLLASTRTFGIASALIGIGMLLGINALNTFGKKLQNSTLVYCGLGGIAAGLVILASITYVWTTLIGNFLIGFSVAGIIIPAQTLIQQETPPALMGRVGSTTMSLIFSAQVAGLVLSGILAQHLGVRQVFTLCAIALAILIAAGRIWMDPGEHQPVAQTA
jgi:MFS family permease